tara:strand:- start:11692 stop:12198 length:507 start_codon:yes stop_codon:yes gene_type:complete
MENENLNDQDFTNKTLNFFKEKKKIIFIILTFLIFFCLIFVYYNSYKKDKNIEISEKYIRAGLLFKNKKKEESLNLYKEIIRSKNKFYGLLSLSNIIENNIEKDNEEILKLFTILENINYEKNQIDLVRLKKALFLRKLNKEVESDNILDEIISSNSIWKEVAIEIKR